MVATDRELATAADLARLSGDARAEVIHGAIVEKASPSGKHGHTQLALGAALTRRFRRPSGGGRPGGWWLGAEIETEYEAHEVFVHDLVGWRMERVPERPDDRPVRIRPDCACEVLSPSNAKRDLVDKLHVLQAHAVPHYWIVDPVERTLIVYRWQPTGYQLALAASAGDIVRAEPFDTVELAVSVLLGLAEDD